MAIEVEFEDTIYEFPDDTSDQQINRFLRKEAGLPERYVDRDIKLFGDKPREEYNIAERDIEDSMNFREDLLISLGFGFDRLGTGIKSSILNVAEKLGTRGIGENAAQKYLDEKNELFKTYEESELGQSTFGKVVPYISEMSPAVAIPTGHAFSALSTLGKVGLDMVMGSIFGHSMYTQDVEDKKYNSLLGLLIPGGLHGTVQTGKAAASSVVKHRGKAGFKRFEREYQANLAEGLDKATSFKRAWTKAKPPNATEELIAGGRQLDISEEAIKEAATARAARESSVLYKTKKAVSEAARPATRRMHSAFTGIAQELEELGLDSIAHSLRKHDMNTIMTLFGRLTIKDSFSENYNKLPKDVKKQFGLALDNGDLDEVDRALSKVKDRELADTMKEETEGVWQLLREMHAEAKDLGMNIGFIENYFPRQIKDWGKYAEKRGITKSQMNVALVKAINNKYKSDGGRKLPINTKLNEDTIKDLLTDDEVARVINYQIYKRKGQGSISTLNDSTRHRTIERLSPEDYDEYLDPVSTLTNYINSMTMKIQTRKYFGGKALSKTLKDNPEFDENSLISGLIRDMVTKMGRDRKLLSGELDRVEEIMQARFIGGKKSPDKWISSARNIMYSAVLGNPLAASTQLADIGASVYTNNIANTAVGLANSFARTKGRVKLEDLGLDVIAHELEHLSGTAKLLEKSLKLGGFKAVDRLGKETVLNSALSKAQAMAKTTKGQSRLVEKYGEAFTPKELGKMLKDLSEGKRATPEIKYLMWHELARVQPISLSEMPAFYLNHPNLRILYMLKTFTLKQIGLLRKEAINEITKGNKTKGTANLVRLGTILGLSNASVEQVKSFITGKDVDFSDAVFPALLRNYALSEWTLDSIKRGQPITAALRVATPPVQVFEDPIRDISEGFKNFRTLKHLPPAGKALDYLFNQEDD